MVNYFIYARDCSFSTFNNEHYHTNGLKTLEEFKRDVEIIEEEQLIAGEAPIESRIIYLHWGDGCWEVDEDKTRTAYLTLNCEQMGTEPEWIIRYIQKKCITDENDKIKLLYIITDGLISNKSAEKCFRRNEFMNYETVVFHAFNEDPDEVDLSVAASFFKNRCIVYRNYELYANTDISKEFDYDKINAYNFVSKKDLLKSYITLKFINDLTRDAVALQEINKLKNLRDRLIEELLLQTAKSDKTKDNPKNIDSNLFQHTLFTNDWKTSLVVAVIVLKADIEKSISVLINHILSETKSYSFDALTFNTECKDFIEDEQIDDFDDVTTAEEEEEEIFAFY